MSITVKQAENKSKEHGDEQAFCGKTNFQNKHPVCVIKAQGHIQQKYVC